MENETRLRVWLEDARAGDAAAAEEVGRVVAQIAQQIAHRRAGALAGGIEWEDVAQEALLRLLRGSAAYRGTGSVRGYVYATVKTSLLQLLRTHRRRALREDRYAEDWIPADAATTTDRQEGWPSLETRRLAEEVLGSLESDCRELVGRVFFHGVSYARLAEEFGQAESTIRARLSRCLQRARERSE